MNYIIHQQYDGMIFDIVIKKYETGRWDVDVSLHCPDCFVITHYFDPMINMHYWESDDYDNFVRFSDNFLQENARYFVSQGMDIMQQAFFMNMNPIEQIDYIKNLDLV